MYKILLFSGGVYRFKDMVETVEDVGGLVLRKDQFEISRGSSYLSDEIQVMLIVPETEKEIVESLCSDIKGQIEEPDVDEPDKHILLTYIPIYNALSRANSRITLEKIYDLIECPCLSLFCENSQDESCVIDELEETLNKLCEQGIAEKKEINGKIQYCLYKDKQE
jgi:hypothetical protein